MINSNNYNILLFLFIILVIGFCIGIIIVIINFIEQIIYWNDPKKMLFLPTKLKLIENELIQIVSKYDINTKNYHLVEMGCGRAGVLRFLNRKYKWKSIMGIEGQSIIWLQAILLSIGTNIIIKKEDFYKTDLPVPAIYYCYLGQVLMADLYKQKKFENSLVISLDYQITGVEYLSCHPLKSNNRIQNNIYVYDFRPKLPTNLYVKTNAL